MSLSNGPLLSPTFQIVRCVSLSEIEMIIRFLKCCFLESLQVFLSYSSKLLGKIHLACSFSHNHVVLCSPLFPGRAGICGRSGSCSLTARVRSASSLMSGYAASRLRVNFTWCFALRNYHSHAWVGAFSNDVPKRMPLQWTLSWLWYR